MRWEGRDHSPPDSSYWTEKQHLQMESLLFRRVLIARFSEFMSIIKYSVEDRLLRWQGVLPNSVVILDMTSLAYQHVYLQREGFVRCSPLSLFLLSLCTHTISYAWPARAFPCCSVKQAPLSPVQSLPVDGCILSLTAATVWGTVLFSSVNLSDTYEWN